MIFPDGPVARRTAAAIRLSLDERGLRRVSERALSEAAILIARAIVQLEEFPSKRGAGVDAVRTLDRAGRAIADELRRRSVTVAA